MISRLQLAAGIVGIYLGTLTGCEKALFPPHYERTPYDRYEQLHGRYRPTSEENAYGGQQPALRDRLRPLAQP